MTMEDAQGDPAEGRLGRSRTSVGEAAGRSKCILLAFSGTRRKVRASVMLRSVKL